MAGLRRGRPASDRPKGLSDSDERGAGAGAQADGSEPFDGAGGYEDAEPSGGGYEDAEPFGGGGYDDPEPLDGGGYEVAGPPAGGANGETDPYGEAGPRSLSSGWGTRADPYDVPAGRLPADSEPCPNDDTAGTTNGEPPFGVAGGGGAYVLGKPSTAGWAVARPEARRPSDSGGKPSEVGPPDVASAG